MTTNRIAAWINREGYDAIKRFTPNDPGLPDTFDEWLKHASEQIANLEANGIVVEKVIIDPQELATYCRASGIEPDRVGREAFAVAKVHRNKK